MDLIARGIDIDEQDAEQQRSANLPSTLPQSTITSTSCES